MADDSNTATKNSDGRTVSDGALSALSQVLRSPRLQMFSRALGMYADNQGNTKRDVWTELGYPEIISLDMYRTMYDRHDISGAVVDAYPDAVWSEPPSIYETPGKDKETPFEQDWRALTDSIHIWSYLQRTEILAGLGQYAGLFIGFRDGKKPKTVVSGNAQGVQYLQPYDQRTLSIDRVVKDPKDPRYGLPAMYKERNGDMKIHPSRILHVACNKLVSDIYGHSDLESVYNRMLDLEQVAGAGRESVWRNAIRKLFLNRPTNSQIADKEKFDEELAQFQHEMSRVLDLRGIEAKEGQVQVADTKPVFDILIACVSARKRIPRRKLLGSETGEQSSEQDHQAWLTEVDKHRQNFCEPSILRPFITMCIEAGAVRPPASGNPVKIRWPELYRASEETRSQVINRKTEALTRYVTNGGSAIIDLYNYFTKIWEMGDEDANAIIGAVGDSLSDEDDEIRKGVEEVEGEGQ